MWYPLLCIKFPVTPNYLKHWRDAHKIFWHCETTNFRRKDVIHPVMYKFFRYPQIIWIIEGFPRNFSARWDRNFSQEKRDILYYTWNFSIPQLFWNIERMPTKICGTRRRKIFAEKTCYLLLYIKFFDTLIFLKHWRNVHKFFRQRETKIFRRKFNIPPIIHKLFRYLKLSGTLKGCPKNFFGTMRSKFFPGKRDTLYYTWNFSTPQLFWNLERMPTENLGTVRPKVFAKKTCYLLYCIKFFDTLFFLKHWRNVHKSFRQCETKIFRRKFVIPSIIHKIFRYLKLSGTLKGCPKKFFGNMRSKNFAGKRDTRYYTWNFSIPQIFRNIERKRTKLFGTVRQKVFNWKMWYPLLCIKFFDTSIYLEHWRDAHKIFRLSETENFCRKNLISFIIHEIFRYPNFSETLNGCPQKFSAQGEEKFSPKKRVTFYYV